MVNSMLKPVRIDAGLGNPPRSYTNNDPEAANFIIKHELNFEAKKPDQFISEIKNIIRMQFSNEERAIFGRGPYRVRQDFTHLEVKDCNWGKMTQQQKVRKVAEFFKAGMDQRRGNLDVEADADKPETSNSTTLSISTLESGIQRVPMPTLELIFEKVNHLLSTPGLVVPQPGSSNGSFIVAGHSNRFYSVTPGKGGALRCDRACIHSATRICEHTLAVAGRTGTLKDFIAWFGRAKKGATVVDLAMQGGPKSAGKKPSRRKRSNAKKVVIEERIDLLQSAGSARKQQSPPLQNVEHLPFAAATTQQPHQLSSMQKIDEPQARIPTAQQILEGNQELLQQQSVYSQLPLPAQKKQHVPNLPSMVRLLSFNYHVTLQYQHNLRNHKPGKSLSRGFLIVQTIGNFLPNTSKVFAQCIDLSIS